MATQAMFANDRDAAADRLPDPGQREVHRLRTAFDLAKDAILFLVPPTMQIVDANRAACDLLGYSYDELLRMRLHKSPCYRRTRPHHLGTHLQVYIG